MKQIKGFLDTHLWVCSQCISGLTCKGIVICINASQALYCADILSQWQINRFSNNTHLYLFCTEVGSMWKWYLKANNSKCLYVDLAKVFFFSLKPILSIFLMGQYRWLWGIFLFVIGFLLKIVYLGENLWVKKIKKIKLFSLTILLFLQLSLWKILKEQYPDCLSLCIILSKDRGSAVVFLVRKKLKKLH